jgi:hypothetical protein
MQVLMAFAIAKTARDAALRMRCISSASKGTGCHRLTPICSGSLTAGISYQRHEKGGWHPRWKLNAILQGTNAAEFFCVEFQKRVRLRGT